MRILNSLFKRAARPEKKEPVPSAAPDPIFQARQLYNAGQFEPALNFCRQIQRQTPDNVELLSLAFDLSMKSRNFAEFGNWLQLAIDLEQDSAELYCLKGQLFLAENKLDDALLAFEKAVQIDPDFARAHNGSGVAFQLLGRLDDAYENFQRALKADANFWKASYNIGNLNKLQGHFETAVVPFQQALYGRRAPNISMDGLDEEDSRVTKAKLNHDIEQLEFLVASGIEVKRASEAVAALAVARERMEHVFSSPVAEFPADIKPIVAPYINRLTNFYSAPALAGGALNQDQDWAAIESAYFANAPGMTYIDNFLKPEALASLRRFCLESTIWFDGRYGDGYVGCTCEDGFICPLLAQIAEEQRLALPSIFGEHRISGLWGYKYDSELTGISVHADYAAINVNFWLAPDDANLDPNGGGLVIWDKEAPLDWNFDDYNNNLPLIAEFLRTSGAKEFVVPHRQNRVVLFNSDLFHKTDSFKFKPGYENRRINVTMLYGDRQQA